MFDEDSIFRSGEIRELNRDAKRRREERQKEYD